MRDKAHLFSDNGGLPGGNGLFHFDFSSSSAWSMSEADIESVVPPLGVFDLADAISRTEAAAKIRFLRKHGPA